MALLTPFAFASPAAAFDWKTEVVDFAFNPEERRIAVGDSVTWNFTAAGHTTPSRRGQPDSWNSPAGTTSTANSAYTKVFDTPGRYQYYCIPHESTMQGVIEVGTDTVADSIDRFRSKRTGHRVKLSFFLNEPATVKYRLTTGPSRRKVNRGRLDEGTHSFTLRRLRRGTYRGVLTVKDDFDNKVTPRNFFVIR
jgi:plastocyanin